MTRDEWVHARLKRLAEAEPEHGAAVPRIDLSQVHLARRVGVSHQALNAARSRLQRRGLLRVSFRMIDPTP